MKTINDLQAYSDREVAVRQTDKGYLILFRSKGVLAAEAWANGLLALDDVAEDWIENGRVPSSANVHPGSQWTEA